MSKLHKENGRLVPRSVFKLTNLDISFVSGCPRGANQGAKVLLKKEKVMDDKETKINVNIDTEALGKSLGETLKKSLDDMLAKKDMDATAISEAVVAIVQGDVAKSISGVQEELKKQLDQFQKDMEEQFKKDEETKKELDETISMNGTTFRKSDVGETVFAAISAAYAEQEKLRKEIEHTNMVARVEKEYPNVAGDPADKANVLALIEKADEKTKAAGLAMLKALNEAGAKLTKEEGSNSNSTVNNDADYKKFATDDDATAKLDALAKEYADKNHVSFAEAYNKVLDTPEGQTLYAQHING